MFWGVGQVPSIQIPKQLQQPGFRFVLLGSGAKGKVPFEKDWQLKGYKYDDPKLLSHNGNYGVIGGYGNLIILDKDSNDLDIDLETFAVRTGSGGMHYYLISDYKENHVFVNKLGELRAYNYQVVGAGCIHPNGKKYEVVKDLPIMSITKKQLVTTIQPYLSDATSINKTLPVESSLAKDTSRSGEEQGIVNKMIRGGKTKTEIWDKMKVYAKWSSSPEQYKEMTYQKGLEFVGDVGLGRVGQASQVFERLRQSKEFIDIQPLFYDKAHIWWMWNFDNYCYEIVDEIDILNGIDEAINLDTTNGKIKSELLNGLKQVGRRNIPQKAEDGWIQFKDMIVDVKTGEEFKASPKYFVTNPIPYSLGNSEDTPTMDNLFKEWVVKKGLQEESYVDTLYEMIAYAAMPHQFLQRLFALQGVGSNGKGCYLMVLKKFLGDENICTTELKILTSKQFESSALYKKQACIMGEVDSYDMQNVNLLKQLTGEDDIRYEFKGKTPFKERSATTCFIATNSLPVTPDQSHGYYRRWLIVDFPHVFPVGKDILATIPEIEFSNLGKKIIRICKELYEKKGFTNEGDAKERMERYEERSNPLMKFIEINIDEIPEEFMRLAVFCKAFNDYLQEHRLRPMKTNAISKALRNEGFQVASHKFYHTIERKDGSDINNVKIDTDIHTTCVFGVKFKK